MAPKDDNLAPAAQPDPEGLRNRFLEQFQPVLTTLPLRGSFQRDTEGARVRPSGLTILNMGGSDLVDTAARSQGLEVEKFTMLWAPHKDLATRQVAGLPVAPGTKGSTPVRRRTGKGHTVYLHGVFKEFPQLSPSSDRWVIMTLEPDGNGGYFVVLHLNSSLTRNPGRGGSQKEEGSAGGKKAAADTRKAARAKEEQPATQPGPSAAGPAAPPPAGQARNSGTEEEVRS